METIDLIEMFEMANRRFIDGNRILFEARVSERTLCGALLVELCKEIEDRGYEDYSVDVEYNRVYGNKVKAKRKTVMGSNGEIFSINSDLIVHKRGCFDETANLIALEMKKSNVTKAARQKDKDRLISMTRPLGYYDEASSIDGIKRVVLGYKLGIYYEINFNKNSYLIIYYKDGEEFSDRTGSL